MVKLFKLAPFPYGEVAVRCSEIFEFHSYALSGVARVSAAWGGLKNAAPYFCSKNL